MTKVSGNSINFLIQRMDARMKTHMPAGTSLAAEMMKLQSNKAQNSYGKESQDPLSGVEDLLTKSKDTLTDEQWNEKISAAAKKQAEETLKTGQFSWSEATEALYMQYVSTVSPDRVSLISAMGGSGIVKVGDEVIAVKTAKGWTERLTKAETKRAQEFSQLFQKYYSAAMAELKENTVMPNAPIDSGLDIQA